MADIKKRDRKVSLFDMQNLLLLSDYIEDEKKISDKNFAGEKALQTIENTEIKRVETHEVTFVSIGG